MESAKWCGKTVYLELLVKLKPDWREFAAFAEEVDWRWRLENLTDGRSSED